MDLSVIIVSWNVHGRLRECLRSVLSDLPPHLENYSQRIIKCDNNDGACQEANRQIENRCGGVASLSAEVFVVDNASTDGTVQMMAEEFPQVKLIVNKENVGFARANNQALDFAQGKYILLLNPDTKILAGALDGMVKFMEDSPRAGVAGCHLVGEEGETVPSARRFPKVWDQALLILKLPHLAPVLLDSYLMKNFDYEKPAEVDSVRGSFFMIRREVVQKIGGLDERYFVWFEEVDYCRQVKKAGWQVMYTPAVKCIDYVGQSFGQLKTFEKQKMFTESLLKYFKKWQPSWQYGLLFCLRPIGLAGAWLAQFFKL